MRLTSEPQEWTPIDPNLENELLNAYARNEELESKAQFLEGRNRISQRSFNDLVEQIKELASENIRLRIASGEIKFVLEKSSDGAVADGFNKHMRAIVLKTIQEQKRPGGLLRND